MAVIAVENGYRISFYPEAGKRKYIRLGDVSKRSAEQIDNRIQSLAESKRLNLKPDPGLSNGCAKPIPRYRRKSNVPV